MNPQRRLLFLGTVFVVAVLARLAMMPKDVTPRPGSDLDEYDTYAWNMAQGRGYRGPSPAFPDREHLTSWRMPGTSLVFAAVYKLAGHKPSAAAVVNVFMSAATCIALFFIGTKLCDERAGRMVAAVYAVWPHAIFLSTNLWSEPLYVLLLLLFVLHCFELAERPDLRNVLLSGFLLGALLYVRPHALLLPFIGFWIILVYWPYWRKMAAACGIFVVAALMLTPWVIRNYRVHGAFVPFTTQGGEALLVGNNRIVATDPAYYGFSLGDARAIPEYAQVRWPERNRARQTVYATVPTMVERKSRQVGVLAPSEVSAVLDTVPATTEPVQPACDALLVGTGVGVVCCPILRNARELPART